MAHVQRQGRSSQPGIQQPGPQEAREPAGTGDQVDGLADDGMPEHLQGLGGGRARAGRAGMAAAGRVLGAGRNRSGPGAGRSGRPGPGRRVCPAGAGPDRGAPCPGPHREPWPAYCRHKSTSSSRAAGSMPPVTTGMRVASHAIARAGLPFSQAAPSLIIHPLSEALRHGVTSCSAGRTKNAHCKTGGQGRGRTARRPSAFQAHSRRKHSGWCGSMLAISVHAALSVRQDQVGEAEDAAVCLDVLAFAGVEPFADFCGAGVGAVSE